MESTEGNEVYDDMNLYITPESFIVEPNNGEEMLVIGRHDKVTRVTRADANQQRPTRRICGVLGTVHLLSCDYLIVATHRIFVGVLNGSIVWRLAGYDIIPYIPNAIQRKENETYLRLLRQTLDSKFFYFSYRYDLTHSLQRQRELLTANPNPRQGLLQRADKRFVWNGYMLRQFNCDKMERFQLPLILGFVSINQVQINGHTFFWSLVTRRSVERAGTRLFCRGSDEQGKVANFVETEQIVEFNGHVTGFVQTRGSMPFFWNQLPNLRYKPRPRLVPGKDHLAACSLHFNDQLRLYGNNVAVNLVDQKGAEGELEATYARLIRELGNKNVRYEAFDFHHECRKMRWDRLNILINRLAYWQDEFGFFHDDGKLVSTQTGVFRTNCIDCLDRTNVVQSMLARRSLTAVLQKLGVLHVGQQLEQAAGSFECRFKGVWADNADLISLQYSGTGALKTDFTRTGKRTKAGAIQDGKNSLMRYYLNNFADGQRQDAMDLFLGKYMINDNEGGAVPSPLESRRGWRFFTFPSVLLMAVAMFMITMTYPAEFNTDNLLFMLFWGAMIAVSATGIMHYGIEFVQWPRLFPPISFQAP